MDKKVKYASQIGANGSRFEVRAAWDDRVIGEVPLHNYAAVDRALEEAYRIFCERERWLPAAERAAILSKAADLLTERTEELTRQAAAEGGKPYADSKVELVRAVDGLRSCVEYIRTSHGEEIPMGITPSSANRLAMTHKEPVGVVLAYSAFNHPVNLIVHQVAPAIATGCPVLVKPAEATPLSCFAVTELLHEAGLPPEYCRTALFGVEDAQKLVADPRVALFSFIGSAEVGWMLRSRLAPGARCVLEHGGAAPVLLAADADLDDAIPLIAKGGFYHAGQVCVSVQRVFAQASVAQEVAQRLADAGAKMKIGDPLEKNTEVGPLIKPAVTDRIEQWVNEAIDAGATLVGGGKRLSDNTFECTVLLDPPEDAKVSQQEIFGPVICVYSVSDIRDAIVPANALPFSFHSAVFTRDIDTAMYCWRHLNATAVMINDHTAFRVDWMPFAGHKHSGYGTGGMRYTCESMQVEKLMVLRSKNLE